MVSFADKELLVVATPQEWERWLIEKGTDDGVKLKLRKRSSNAPGLTYDEALDVALCHGWIDGQVARFDDDYVLQAFTPRRRNSPWSQRNVGHVERLIAAGLMREGGQAEIDRAKADGRWDAAYQVKDAPVPDDLRAALDAAGIGCEVYYPVTLDQHDCFTHLPEHSRSNCDIAHRLALEVLSLPVYPELPESGRDQVVATIAGWLSVNG